MTTESNNSLLLNATHVSNELKSIASKVFNGYRISVDEGITLFEKGELNFLGILANFVREKKNGDNVYFNRNFHIEPTNICGKVPPLGSAVAP